MVSQLINKCIELWILEAKLWILEAKRITLDYSKPPQPFYGPFSGTTLVSRCQKRISGLYGARED